MERFLIISLQINFYTMKRLYFTLFLVFLFTYSFAQESQLFIKGKVDNDIKEPLSGCNNQLFQDDNLIKMITADSSGRFNLDSLPVGHIYDLFFEAENYALKFVRIDVKSADPKDMVKFPLEINMALFSTIGVKPEKLYFLQSEPYAIARYNSVIENIEWDAAYLEKMKKKTDQARGLK